MAGARIRQIRLSAAALLQILAFYARLWLVPKYAIVAFKFKFRYFMSLIQALVWGYGERPSRIIVTAILLLTVYAVVFYGLLNRGHVGTVSFVDSSYLDSRLRRYHPKTSLMKMACGSEAAVGAFVLGLVVAEFAKRSRY